MIAEAKRRYELPIRTLAVEMGLSPATLPRWRRLSREQAAIGRRGPRKVKPLNIGEPKERIAGLGRGKKRSRGSGAVHRAYAGVISRWQLDAMVCAVGQETSRSRVVNTYHVSWLRPNLAWAMDDCDKNERTVDGTLHLHNLTDLHSRYRLPPLASYGLPCGEEVAGHLQYLFDRFDPPLFCKRDNGGKGTNPRKKRTLSTQRVEVQSDLDQLLFEIEVGKQVLTSPKRQDNRQVTILKTKKEEGRQ